MMRWRNKATGQLPSTPMIWMLHLLATTPYENSHRPFLSTERSRSLRSQSNAGSTSSRSITKGKLHLIHLMQYGIAKSMVIMPVTLMYHQWLHIACSCPVWRDGEHWRIAWCTIVRAPPRIWYVLKRVLNLGSHQYSYPSSSYYWQLWSIPTC